MMLVVFIRLEEKRAQSSFAVQNMMVAAMNTPLIVFYTQPHVEISALIAELG
jgi:hypothetical protein